MRRVGRASATVNRLERTGDEEVLSRLHDGAVVPQTENTDASPAVIQVLQSSRDATRCDVEGRSQARRAAFERRNQDAQRCYDVAAPLRSPYRNGQGARAETQLFSGRRVAISAGAPELALLAAGLDHRVGRDPLEVLERLSLVQAEGPRRGRAHGAAPARPRQPRAGRRARRGASRRPGQDPRLGTRRFT